MGSNTLLIIPGAASSGGVTMGAGSVQTLTPDDADEREEERHQAQDPQHQRGGYEGGSVHQETRPRNSSRSSWTFSGCSIWTKWLPPY